LKQKIMLARLAFAALFIVLLTRGALMAWLLLYAVSLVFPLLFGKRVYCMAVCPINTLMLGVVWLKGKLKLKDSPPPKWLTRGTWAWISLGVTVALFILSRRVLERTMPVMLLWLAVAALLTLRYHPDVFHDLLCPYGLPQRLLARVSLKSEEGRRAARNYRGFTASVLQAGKNKAPGKMPEAGPR